MNLKVYLSVLWEYLNRSVCANTLTEISLPINFVYSGTNRLTTRPETRMMKQTNTKSCRQRLPFGQTIGIIMRMLSFNPLHVDSLPVDFCSYWEKRCVNGV